MTLTAQNRSLPQQDSGFVFHDCQITADPAVRELSLGRPWGPLATVAYLGCRIDAPVLSSRFSEWPGTTRLQTALFSETGDAARNTPAAAATQTADKGLGQTVTLCTTTADQLKGAEGFFAAAPLQLDGTDHCIR